MINLKDLKPAIPIHPGKLLQDELASRHMPLTKFVNKAGAKRSDIVAILQCKMAITKELATIIGNALDIDPEIWLFLQKNYEADRDKIDSK